MFELCQRDGLGMPAEWGLCMVVQISNGRVTSGTAVATEH